MKAKIIKAKSLREINSPEGCYICENWSTEGLSIALARVESGVTTRKHRLNRVNEIYFIKKGRGEMEVGNTEPVDVVAGDTVFIPSGSSQRTKNNGKTDLLFYCICTPKFIQGFYRDEEDTVTGAPTENTRDHSKQIEPKSGPDGN